MISVYLFRIGLLLFCKNSLFITSILFMDKNVGSLILVFPIVLFLIFRCVFTGRARFERSYIFLFFFFISIFCFYAFLLVLHLFF